MLAEAVGSAETLQWGNAGALATASFVHLGERHRETSGLPRILLLHGNPATKEDWAPFARHMRDVAEAVALDLPGFGASERVAAAEGTTLLERHADCARAVIDRLGWTECIVVGHSHGGAVAHALAVRHPELVRGVALIAAPGVRTHPSYRLLCLPGLPAVLAALAWTLRVEMLRSTMRLIMRAILKPMFRPRTVPEGRVAQQHGSLEARPRALVEMALLARDRPCEQLARTATALRAPTLFIHGDADEIVPMSYARTLYDAIPRTTHSTFRVVPEAGHMVHETHARQVRELLLQWIAEIS
jgi:pimeloyl-ACP methyl ester carboxylesterase